MIKTALNTRIETLTGVAIILFVTFSLSLLVFSKISDFHSYVDLLNSEYSKEGVLIISLREAKRIERWIKKNSFNEYGDPKGTVYAGGTPLFNEASNESINRWEYIVKKYPERPWR